MSNSVEQDEAVEQEGEVQEAGGSEPCCDAACSCNARGLSTRAKVAVCLLVAVAALAVLLLGSANKSRAMTGKDQFAASAAAPETSPAEETPGAPTAPAADTPSAPVTPASTTAPGAPAAPAGAADGPATPAPEKAESTAVWGPTLSSLSALNEVALDKDAVFILVESEDGKQTAAIRAQVAAATKKARSRGSSVVAYMLSKDAEEYAQLSQQVPPPCVLAIVKGAGSATVSGEITEVKLLEALVTASRPSSCGPSGCGPSGCG